MSPRINDPVILNRWNSNYGKKKVIQIQKWNIQGINDAIRINSLVTRNSDLILDLKNKNFDISKTSLSGAYTINSKPKTPSLGATHEFLIGKYAIQGLASQFVPTLFDLKNDSTNMILDMTAAPGGKTSQLAALINNEGAIIAIDSSKKRLSSLRSTLARLSVANVSVFKGFSQNLVPKLGLFNKILLDAPCSGSGSICRRPSTHWFKNLNNISRLENIQNELLNIAIKALALDGELVYSVCSLEPEECEKQIFQVLNQYPDEIILDKIHPLPEWKNHITSLSNKIYENTNPEIQTNCLRILPHRLTEGFFIAKLRRISNAN